MKHNSHEMKYQQLKKWQNNPKVKALLFILVIIKIIIVVMIARL
jgi:hypothetical protein